MNKEDHLKKQGEKLFDGRGNLMSLWQEIADNFYPERGDFTNKREIGDEFTDHLDTSYPILARRDLGNEIGGMLRPTNKDWFSMRKRYDENLDTEAKAWLEWATNLQKRAMYDPMSMFTRATKEGDHDWAAFGQTVISVELNLNQNALLYRCWHLRDVAWMEDEIGRTSTVYRKWKPTALTLKRIFGDKLHPKILKCISDNKPYEEFEIWHCNVPSEAYEYKTDLPFMSVYYDPKHKHIIEELPAWENMYVIPRWQTVSGSQYAFSPATVAALPDARLIQSIARLLLDAGEKAIDPPMLAVQEAIRSDISIYSGGITWVDSEYDERLGEVLRPLSETGNVPLGFEMSQDTREMISEAFYLNKLNMPPSEREMTAYETGKRIQEFIRQTLPLFEPMETEYNGSLCEKTFNVLMRNGGFGDPRTIPQSLQGSDITFKFESPLHEASEQVKGQKFGEAKQMIREAIELDPGSQYILDAKVALRDVLDGIGAPIKWQRSEHQVQQMEESDLKAQQAQELLAGMGEGADVAKTMSEISAS